MNTYENEIDIPGEIDTTLYDDMMEYFGTPPTPTEVTNLYGTIFEDWDDFGYMYTDMIGDCL